MVLCLGAASASAALPTAKWVTIPSDDGVRLKAIVFMPGNIKPGDKPPGIAFAAAWNGGAEQNSVPSMQLARKGYVVVSYTTRGTGIDTDKRGFVEMGGPKDIMDMSAIIDWMVTQRGADPDRIGAAGISYGAGIALMASGVDKRIKSVVSMSGWTDLGRALFPNETRNSWPGFILWASAKQASNESPEFNEVFNQFFQFRKSEETLAFARGRSAISYLDRINANRPAIMMSQNWNELAFPPDQFLDFYEDLQVPRRLYLRPGDHVGQETMGLLGQWSPVFSRMYRWFDQTVRDPSQRESLGQQIEIQPRAPYGDRREETYTNWSDATTGTKRWHLGAVMNKKGDGGLADAPQTEWSTTIKPGLNVVNHVGGPIVSHLTEVWWGRPVWSEPKYIDRKTSATWLSGPMTDWVRMRGSAKVHVTVTPTHAKGFLNLVLWSIGNNNSGRHITHAPITWRNRTPGKPFTLDLELRPNAYNIPPGHRLLLAASTFEPNYYLERNPPGSTLTFSSPAGDPSWIDLPTR
ncbi:MAG: prolyl oligopeptidase family serine peptidase [Solirubrobacteraceae bacterium]|nr:prolyl oligopeptidase family serine peptidase [Solirubrobacteraceae bacterium]